MHSNFNEAPPPYYVYWFHKTTCTFFFEEIAHFFAEIFAQMRVQCLGRPLLHILSANLIDSWEWQPVENHMLQTPSKVHSKLCLVSQTDAAPVALKGQIGHTSFIEQSAPKISRQKSGD